MTYGEILKSAFDVYFDAPTEAWNQFVEYCEWVTFSKDEVS